MGEQLFLEHFAWFRNQTRPGRHPNAIKLAARSEISTKTARRSAIHISDRRQARLAYLQDRRLVPLAWESPYILPLIVVRQRLQSARCEATPPGELVPDRLGLQRCFLRDCILIIVIRVSNFRFSLLQTAKSS
jgi:hypothetical protein